MYVVTVTIKVVEGREEELTALVLENAAASLSGEPGCHRFDVCREPGRTEELFLYEVYADEAAFEVHRSMRHYREFVAQSEGMMRDRVIRSYDLIPPP